MDAAQRHQMEQDRLTEEWTEPDHPDTFMADGIQLPDDRLDRDEGRVGMICEDMTDGGFVKLDRPYEPWVWECAVWCNGHWSYEGARIHLSELRRIARPPAEMTA